VKASKRQSGFTLVELLVVIGIIGLLISMLLPALTKAQAAARTVACSSNLRQLGINLQLYGDSYKGWIFPVGPWEPIPAPGQYASLGSNVDPHQRWPMAVFRFSHPSLEPAPTFTGTGDSIPDDEVKPWTPAVMLCPADQEPRSAHSYIVNKLLVKNQQTLLKYGGKTDKKGPSEIIVAGEKTTIAADYYMELNIVDGMAVDSEGNPVLDENGDQITEFNRVVEQSRHGRNKGSNYLYFDGHVELRPSEESRLAFDPWNL
jgi:prepilin-type N-terminal cleavage/methylation domain-containing protein/prepilin-type processing-associated H-X9-DG protein